MDFLLLCILFLVIGYIIYATTRIEITYCDPTECASCPFPHEGCTHRKELFYSNLVEMDGQYIYIDLDGRLIPVRVYIADMKNVWLVSEMGSMTTYDDIKKAGGKFFEKFSKTP